jgi:hypothetical protein
MYLPCRERVEALLPHIRNISSGRLGCRERHTPFRKDEHVDIATLFVGHRNSESWRHHSACDPPVESFRRKDAHGVPPQHLCLGARSIFESGTVRRSHASSQRVNYSEPYPVRCMVKIIQVGLPDRAVRQWREAASLGGGERAGRKASGRHGN